MKTKILTLFLCCLPAFGQLVYQEITVPPELLANQVSSISLGTDDALWMFLPNGKLGIGSFYRSNSTSGTTSLVGSVNGLPFVNSVATSNDTYSLWNVPSPQGKDNLLGYNNPSPGILVIAQANNGLIKTICSAYTVDSGKGVMPQHLTRGPFPNYDGTYSLAGTTIIKVGAAYTLSSTLFELGAVNSATTTCDLRTVVTVDKEIFQSVKLPGGKYLVNQVTLPALSYFWQTRIGLLTPDGTYTDLISKDSAKFPAARCCFMSQDWGTANAAIAYFGVDGKSHGLTYINGLLTEVFNSGVAGQLTVDIWTNDFKGNFVSFGGSNRTVEAADELILVDITAGKSTVIGAYNSAINGTTGYAMESGMATLDSTGAVYFHAYNTVDKTSHKFKAFVPGPVTIESFKTDLTTIAPGDSVVMSWATRNATTVTITGLGPGGGLGVVPGSGSMPITPTQTTTYTMTATGPAGSATTSLTVTVTPRVLSPIITSGVLNAASSALAISPGTYATVFGTDLSYSTASSTTLPLPTTPSGVQVLVNGVPAPVTYVSLNQINFLIPYEAQLGLGIVQVVRSGVAGNAATMLVTPTSPGVFQTAGFGIVTDATTGQLVTAENPLVLGNLYSLWLTGLGLTDCPSLKSGVASNAVCNAVVQPALTIGGLPATIYYAGLQPQFPGLYQINFLLPGQSRVPSLQERGVVIAGDMQTTFNIIGQIGQQ